MPNRHSYGFRWAWSYNGNTMPPPIPMHVASGQNDIDDANVPVNIWPGDPVERTAGGGAIVCRGGATIATEVYGICVGILRYWDGNVMRGGRCYPNNTVWGAIEDRRGYILVVPARAGYWEIDADDAVTAVNYAAYRALIHSNCQHVCPGNATLGAAEPLLDISTTNVTNTLEWRIDDVSRTLENQDFTTGRLEANIGAAGVTSAWVKLIVRANVVSEAGEVASGGAVVGL